MYVNIQELLLKYFAGEPCDTGLAEVVKMYSEYFDSFPAFALITDSSHSEWGLTLQNLTSMIW